MIQPSKELLKPVTQPVLRMFQGDGLVHNFMRICPARAKKKKKQLLKNKTTSQIYIYKYTAN